MRWACRVCGAGVFLALSLSLATQQCSGEEVVSLEVAGLRVEEGGVSVDFELTVSNVTIVALLQLSVSATASNGSDVRYTKSFDMAQVLGVSEELVTLGCTVPGLLPDLNHTVILSPAGQVLNVVTTDIQRLSYLRSGREEVIVTCHFPPVSGPAAAMGCQVGWIPSQDKEEGNGTDNPINTGNSDTTSHMLHVERQEGSDEATVRISGLQEGFPYEVWAHSTIAGRRLHGFAVTLEPSLVLPPTGSGLTSSAGDHKSTRDIALLAAGLAAIFSGVIIAAVVLLVFFLVHRTLKMAKQQSRHRPHKSPAGVLELWDIEVEVEANMCYNVRPGTASPKPLTPVEEDEYPHDYDDIMPPDTTKAITSKASVTIVVDEPEYENLAGQDLPPVPPHSHSSSASHSLDLSATHSHSIPHHSSSPSPSHAPPPDGVTGEYEIPIGTNSAYRAARAGLRHVTAL